MSRSKERRGSGFFGRDPGPGVLGVSSEVFGFDGEAAIKFESSSGARKEKAQSPIRLWHKSHWRRAFSALIDRFVGNRRETSVECLGYFGGVRGRDTDEARDKAGLGGADDVTELARVRDTRRRGSGGDGGTRLQPNRDARMALSEGSDWAVGGCGSSPFVLSEGLWAGST